MATAAASAGTWSPIQELSQFQGSTYPERLNQLQAADGTRTIYWVLDDAGTRTLQATKLSSEGVPGATVDVADLSADDAQDLEAVVDADGKVTFAWIAGFPAPDRIKSVQLATDGTVGPVAVIATPAVPGDSITQLSIAVTPNKTVGYAWRRKDVAELSTMEARTVPDGGAPGTIRAYSEAPISITDPNIVALPDNAFRLSWVAQDTDSGFGNIALVGAQNDGTQIGSVSYLFPRTEPLTGIVNGVCQQLRDPDTNELLTKDSGATGDPRNLQMGANAAGATNLAWRRFVVTGEKDCDGNIPVVETEQLAVETVRIDEFGSVFPVTRVSPSEVDVLSLRMHASRNGRSTLAWFADDDGSFSTQIFRFSDSGIWTISTDDNFVNPNMIAGSDLSVGIGWTQGGELPFQGVARAAFLTRNGQLVFADIPGLGSLKASSRTLADPGTLGKRFVTFYGLTQADVGGLWRSSFSDPGIKSTPSTVTFGGTPVGTRSAVSRVFLQNNGTTPTEVLDVAITGGDSSQFQLLNPLGCVGELTPGEFCQVQVRFSPDSAGLMTSEVKTTTDSSAVSTELRGQALSRTRLGLRVKAPRRAVRAGGKAVYRATVTNRGGIDATGVRACLNGPGSGGVKPGRICLNVGSVAPGASRTVRFAVRASRTARPGSYALLLRSSGKNARTVRTPATLRVRR